MISQLFCTFEAENAITFVLPIRLNKWHKRLKTFLVKHPVSIVTHTHMHTHCTYMLIYTYRAHTTEKHPTCKYLPVETALTFSCKSSTWTEQVLQEDASKQWLLRQCGLTSEWVEFDIQLETSLLKARAVLTYSTMHEQDGTIQLFAIQLLGSCLKYVYELEYWCIEYFILILWACSFSKRLMSVTFAEEKVLIFLILCKNANIVQLWV